MRKYFRYFKYCGVASIILFFFIVGIGIYYNPAFSFFKNAFSDLGSYYANFPTIFNVGLFFVAILMFLFSIYMMEISGNKMQTIAGAYISIASIFISLIGLYNENTKPHDFIALYFFIQYFLGIITYGLGNWKNKVKLSISLLLFGGFILVFFIPWPSLAMAESYAILLILTFTILVWKTER
ncbi:DUF998 domain-containing protein [Mesoaciditoga lauensis]|uniref:DUF998 domain-containing protein n=1 Tax=Mesoaciditoga lauensis TaxID=1495039 RepID=UPI000563E603|nr:DUF998 domain-containing protein [Mesoaciditoga lauensis]